MTAGSWLGLPVIGARLVGEEAEVNVLAGLDDDLAVEPREQFGEGVEVEPAPGGVGGLAGLGEDLGEPLGLAAGGLDAAIEGGGGAVGDLEGLALGVARARSRYSSAPITARRRSLRARSASANAGATASGGATRPRRTARIETPRP